jgi:two-component system phosphate regulon sensor histidine kinase PhoR
MNTPAVYGAVMLSALLAIVTNFVGDWDRVYTEGRLDLFVAVGVIADIIAVSLFVFGTGGALAHFFVLLLCDVVFAAIFFRGIELVLILGIALGCYSIVMGQGAQKPTLLWDLLLGAIVAIVLAWLAVGLGRVLDLERLSNLRIIRSLAVGIALVTRDRRVAVANPQLGRLADAPLDALMGRTVEQIGGPTAPGMLPQLSAEPREVEIDIDEPEPIVISRSVVPCEGTAGGMNAWVVTWQDITETAARVRAKESGISSVSHEIRSPVSNLRMMVEVLQGVAGDLDEQRRQEILDHLETQTDRLARVVASLMDLATLESPEAYLHRTDVDIDDMMQMVVDILDTEAAKAGVVFVCDWAGELPAVWGDEDRLRQLFICLCENAITYTPSGGTVTISIVPGDEHISCTVTDTGIGMSEEMLQRVFEKFAAGPRSEVAAERGQYAGGLGLGLALAKRITDLHYGDIGIESTEGRGTTVTVTLPYKPPAHHRPYER